MTKFYWIGHEKNVPGGWEAVLHKWIYFVDNFQILHMFIENWSGVDVRSRTCKRISMQLLKSGDTKYKIYRWDSLII